LSIGSFDDLVLSLGGLERKRRIAVVGAEDAHTLEAVVESCSAGLISPWLIGRSEAIKATLEKLGQCPGGYDLVEAHGPEQAAGEGARLVREGLADAIMKGGIETARLMRVLLDKSNGLHQGNLMSLLAFMQIPNTSRLVGITDVGLNLYPKLAEKQRILENAVHTFHKLGINAPKVAVLAAVEQANPKMPETIDGQELSRMNAEGLIQGCIVAGPISYDLAMNDEAAAIKGYHSPVAGAADILLVPDIVSGNVLAKALIFSAGAKTAGIVVGARVPIVITSRSASAEDKFLSIALASYVGQTGEI
jgi:phosphate butyryltransferase